MPPLTENMLVGFYAVGGFFFISSLTWFFSSRRKWFIRTFVPADELRNVLRDRGLRNEELFRQGMRTIACLQFGVTFLILLVTLYFWLVGALR